MIDPPQDPMPEQPHGPGHEHPHHSPPSAAGELEPYAVRILLRPQTEPLDAAAFLQTLLERVATSCVEAGAALVGHLKCVLHTPRGRLLCNLTSRRSGARCRGEGSQTILPGDEAGLDLVVLVYGVPARNVGRIVHEVLEALLSPSGTWWEGTAGPYFPEA